MLDNEIARLDKELRRLEKVNIQLSSENREFRDELGVVGPYAQKTITQLEEVQANLEEVEAELADTKKTHRQHDTLQEREINELQVQRRAMMAEIAKLREELDGFWKDNEDLNTENVKMRRYSMHLMTENAAFREESENRMEGLTTETEERLQNQVKEFEEEIQRLKELGETNAELEGQVLLIKRQLSDANADLATKNSDDSQQIKELETKAVIVALRQERDKFADELKELQAAYRQREGTNAELRGQVVLIKRQLSDANADLAIKDSEDQEMQKNETDTVVATLRQERDKLANEVKELHSAYHQYKETNAELVEQIVLIEGQLSETTADLATMGWEKSREIEELEAEKAAEILRLKDQVALLEAESERIGDAPTQDGKIDAVEVELDLLRRRLEETSKRETELREELRVYKKADGVLKRILKEGMEKGRALTDEEIGMLAAGEGMGKLGEGVETERWGAEVARLTLITAGQDAGGTNAKQMEEVNQLTAEVARLTADNALQNQKNGDKISVLESTIADLNRQLREVVATQEENVELKSRLLTAQEAARELRRLLEEASAKKVVMEEVVGGIKKEEDDGPNGDLMMLREELSNLREELGNLRRANEALKPAATEQVGGIKKQDGNGPIDDIATLREELNNLKRENEELKAAAVTTPKKGGSKKGKKTPPPPIETATKKATPKRKRMQPVDEGYKPDENDLSDIAVEKEEEKTPATGKSFGDRGEDGHARYPGRKRTKIYKNL